MWGEQMICTTDRQQVMRNCNCSQWKYAVKTVRGAPCSPSIFLSRAPRSQFPGIFLHNTVKGFSKHTAG